MPPGGELWVQPHRRRKYVCTALYHLNHLLRGQSWICPLSEPSSNRGYEVAIRKHSRRILQGRKV